MTWNRIQKDGFALQVAKVDNDIISGFIKRPEENPKVKMKWIQFWTSVCSISFLVTAFCKVLFIDALQCTRYFNACKLFAHYHFRWAAFVYLVLFGLGLWGEADLEQITSPSSSAFVISTGKEKETGSKSWKVINVSWRDVKHRIANGCHQVHPSTASSLWTLAGFDWSDGEKA